MWRNGQYLTKLEGMNPEADGLLSIDYPIFWIKLSFYTDNLFRTRNTCIKYWRSYLLTDTEAVIQVDDVTSPLGNGKVGKPTIAQKVRRLSY